VRFRKSNISMVSIFILLCCSCYYIAAFSFAQNMIDMDSGQYLDETSYNEKLIDRLHLLTLRRQNIGSASGILHFASSATNIQPVCFDFSRCDAGLLNFVSHQLCVRQGFQTVRENNLISKDVFIVNEFDTINAWNTSIREDVGSISCNRRNDLSCSHFLQIECGDCHYSFTLSNNDIYIRSPLYPTVAAGLICKYDISSNYKLEVSVLNLDISSAVQTSVGQSEHCMHSFLQVQTLFKTSGEERIGDLYTLCGQLNNKIILTNGKHVRLLFVTGKSRSGSLFLSHQTGFLVKISKTTKSSKLLQGIIVGSGIFVPTLCFLCIFFSHKLRCGKCKKRKERGRRRGRINHYRHHHHSTWIGNLPRHEETLHEAGTRRLQRFVESEENSYVMDNRVSTRNLQIQRPLPEIPEEYVSRLTSSEEMRCDSNNNITDREISTDVPDISLYETLRHNIKVENKDEHIYLSLVNSPEGIDDGEVEPAEIKRIPENCAVDHQDDEDSKYSVLPASSRSRTSTNRVLRSSVCFLANNKAEIPEISNKAEKCAKGTDNSNILPTTSISLANEDWFLTPNGLTPIKHTNGSGMTIFSRNLSMISARLASLASYTSLKRKSQRDCDESLNLIEEGIDYESSLKDEDDDVFQEN